MKTYKIIGDHDGLPCVVELYINGSYDHEEFADDYGHAEDIGDEWAR